MSKEIHFLILLLTINLSITSGGPVEQSKSEILPKEGSFNHVQNTSNYTASHYKDQAIVDKCYESQRRNSKENSLRGLQKTLRALGAIALQEDNTYRPLNVPPALVRYLHKQDDSIKPPKQQLVRCPIAETIYPCTCESNTAVIDCSSTGNFTRVREIFHTAPFIDKSFERFLMYGVGVQVPSETLLRAGTFGQATFREIVIESNRNLRAVETGAFRGSEYTLRLIQMEYNNQLQVFPFEDLSNFYELQELKLSYGKIQEVTSLNTVPKLETILLNGNSIQSINSYAFARLPNLMTIDLGRNLLTTIQAHDLTMSAPDVVVYIDNNLILNIEDETFSNEQPSLLDIYGNQMKTLNASVFQPILDNIIKKQYDSYIDAEENPLCCLGIEWILQNPSYFSHVSLPIFDCYNKS